MTSTTVTQEYIDTEQSVQLSLLLGLLSLVIITYLFTRLMGLANTLKEYHSSHYLAQYYAHIVRLCQFMAIPSNAEMIAQYYRPNSNIREIALYMLQVESPNDYSYYFKLNYQTEVRYYGETLFNFEDDGKYFPVHYGNTTYFTNFPELSVYIWMVEYGIVEHIENNKDFYLNKMQLEQDDMLDDTPNMENHENIKLE